VAVGFGVAPEALPEAALKASSLLLPPEPALSPGLGHRFASMLLPIPFCAFPATQGFSLPALQTA
jgi:hypothetical protein